MFLRQPDLRQLMITILLVVIASTTTQAADSTPRFESDVRPVLKAHCFQCHGESGKLKGGLDVRLNRLLLKGGENGPAIVPGKPADSLLFQKVRDGEMPKGEHEKKLTTRELATIETWIAVGGKVVRPEPDDPDAAPITKEKENFWSFQPIRRPNVPAAPADARVRNPIDAFLWEKL